MDNQSPINALPPVIVVICVVMGMVELAFGAGAQGLAGGPEAIGWRLQAIQSYAFAPPVLDAVWARGDYGIDMIRRFVTYPFVHGSFSGAAFGIALILALGKFVGDAFGNVVTLLLLLLTTVFGALVFGVVLTGPSEVLLGAFPPAYGLIGAYTYLIWLHLGRSGENQLAAFRLIGVLMGLQLIFGVIGSFAGGVPKTWIAEVAAFVFGFVVAPLMAPGGWTAFLDRMRDR